MVGGVAGYLIGNRAERTDSHLSVIDAQASKTLVVIQRDIQLLTEMRQRKHLDLVKDLELWTVLQLQQIDPSKFVKGSAAEYLYPHTREMVNSYRKQFPETMINPDNDPSITKAFAGVP
jgi:hypothetical protein